MEGGRRPRALLRNNHPQPNSQGLCHPQSLLNKTHFWSCHRWCSRPSSDCHSQRENPKSTPCPACSGLWPQLSLSHPTTSSFSRCVSPDPNPHRHLDAPLYHVTVLTISWRSQTYSLCSSFAFAVPLCRMPQNQWSLPFFLSDLCSDVICSERSCWLPCTNQYTPTHIPLYLLSFFLLGSYSNNTFFYLCMYFFTAYVSQLNVNPLE